jgi:glycosyltransferase involved in cell wall biosynthesis
VDYICIIDDGSSEEDVTVMEKCVENYDIPYKFIRKKEKGHAKSMNLIVDTMSDLRARFFIHLEDDFEFFVKAPIIQDSLKVLSQEKYGQCLFNNSYKEERVDFMSTPYGIKKRVDNVVFYEHLWNDNTPYGYWPGFSLRPGVNRLKSFTTTGKFIENGSSFEMEYALRYEQKWKTAYLETIFCEHIGRKTSERFDVDKQNAYVLNDTKQFGDLNKVSISSAKIESKIPFQEKKELYSHIKLWMMLSENYTNEQIYVVNDPKISSPLMEKLSQIHFYWDVVLVRKDQTMLRMVSAEKICENELKNGYILYHTGARKLLEKVYESPMNTIAEYMKRAELIIYETY